MNRHNYFRYPLHSVFIKRDKSEKLEDCVVCFTELASNLRRLPCNHIYHRDCLAKWLALHSTCPTCRKPVLTVQN